MRQTNRPEVLDVSLSTSSLLSSTSLPPQHSSYRCGSGESGDYFSLDLMEERAVRGNNRGNYEEIDLISECSTPSTYTPGKYLQLCDLYSPPDGSDVTLWPALMGEPPDDWETSASLDLPHKPRKSFDEGSRVVAHKNVQLTSYSSHRHCRYVRCLSNRAVVIIAVCLIIALSALGSVAVVI